MWRATLSGLAASLVGVGLARFAYTPLIPAVIAAGWFTPAQAVWLGAANLVGYLIGALAALALARHGGLRPALRGAMLAATASFFTCAAPAAFAWFFLWRLAAGAAGGVLMVLAAPALLPLVPAERRGLAAGLIFTGVGLGIAASGTLIPPLLHLGLGPTWLTLGGLALGLTAAAWNGFPAHAPTPRHSRTTPSVRAVLVPTVTYGMNAIGLVPHMVFLVDFVARGLGRGMAAGAGCWVAFGLGALVGPSLSGLLADRLGFARTQRAGLLLQAACVALPALSAAPASLLLSATVIGAFTPGTVPLMLGRIHTQLPPGSDAARMAWRCATVAWALGQAAGGQAFSAMFARTGSYTPLFATAAAVLLAAFLFDVAATNRRRDWSTRPDA